MKRQGGFTLIELVVVIVILGILAVTAAPKFLNLQDDARNATLNGFKGSLQGAASMVYAKAAIDGKESAATETVDGNGDGTENVNIVYGYPKAADDDIQAIMEASFGTNGDWKLTTAVPNADSTTVYYTLSDVDDTATGGLTKCYVSYKQATDSALPVYTVEECQ